MTKKKKSPSRSKPGGAKKMPARDSAQARKESPGSAAAAEFQIVGIGASAGGLQALQRIFDAMPDDPGCAFVVVQHLDPTRRSLTAELLAKHTHMKMCEVQDSPVVQVNTVYVIPPGKYLSISRGAL